MRRYRARSGFTLLEMAIVLVIIGVITGMSLFFGMGAVESAKRTQTENKMMLIENTLQAYREQYDRLPCPGDATVSSSDTTGKYGTEASNPGACTGGAIVANYSTSGGIVEGSVPTATLNLPDTFMYDGWGRKFVYAVNSSATAPLAFQSINLDDSCGITVDDAASPAHARTGGAIYTLLSFGEDGHGGYLSDGTRYSAAATDGDELKNCHCDSSAADTGYLATYVQKDQTETSPTSKFDDLVEFKQRWQMQDYEDWYTPFYSGPQLLVGYHVAGSNSAYVYRLQCGKLKKLDDLTPPAVNDATGVVFLPSNSAMLVFSSAGCQLYTITDGVVSGGATVPSCPAYNTSVRVSLSENGYLAISQHVGPNYVHLWKQSGNNFATISDPSSEPGSQPDSISISDDYLVVSSSTGDYMTVYGRIKDAFAPVAPQPSFIPPNPYSSAISPNQMYIGATTNTSPPSLYLWHVNSAASITNLGNISFNTSGDNPAGLTFSPDGRYIAAGGSSGDNINLFKIDDGDVITQLAAPTGWTSGSSTAGTGFAFSRDSSYVAMVTPSTTSPLVLFRWVAADKYQYATVPDTADRPSQPGLSAAFSY